MKNSPLPTFTRYEKFLIAMLSFLQFTIILDFMVLSPLGAVLMPALNISPTQFGMVVSVYAFSAGASGFLAAGFADRFDRKKLLLFFYSGFVLGTFLCGVAPSYSFLLGARMFTGIFGGVIGSIVLAITADLFPYEKRGRVMGFVQTSFAASQILGIPVALYLSNLWGWHAPFMLIVGVSTIVGISIFAYLKPINAHLQGKIDTHAFHHLFATVRNKRYLKAFGATALLATGGFMIMPFSSAFTVHNLGVSLEQLPLVYMITGICAIFTGPLVGRAADKIGKFKMFFFGSVVSVVMVNIYTHLGATSLAGVVVVSALMFVGISSRMIPSQALMSAIPDMKSRGAFMSVSASLQQISGGLAAALAGLIVRETSDGALVHFDVLGFVVSATVFITLIQMFFISREIVKA